jgi:hypothetical protein
MENEETVCTGNDVEMKTIGGEIGFITAMIADSLILQESILWYTAMVGKKSSIGILKKILQKEGIPKEQIFTTVFAQGVTYRWGLAWTFIPEAAALYMSYQLLHGSNSGVTATVAGHNGEESDMKDVELPGVTPSCLVPQVLFGLHLLCYLFSCLFV